jgi:hypothetical protein
MALRLHLMKAVTTGGYSKRKVEFLRENGHVSHKKVFATRRQSKT